MVRAIRVEPVATARDKGGGTDNEIRYEGLASRAELVDSTGTTRYAWDGIRVLKLEDEEGTLMPVIHALSSL